MNSWQQIVSSRPAAHATFPECAICDLDHFGLIRISGSEMRQFLQGQLTNDINKVTAEQVQLSSYCSPKGRMLGSFWIFQRGEDLYLQLPKALLPAVLKRLQMFVLRTDARLEDASESLGRFGVSGACAAELLPFAPADEKACETRDEVTIFRLPGSPDRFEVIAPDALIANLWQQATGRAEHVGADHWALADIRAGIPNVLEDTVEAFVPQMANLQLLGGISFTKGCYTGQEVVARMQYLGKLKRRMYRARVDGEQRPMPGTELYSPSSESGQGAGRVVDAAPSPDGGFEVLAVLQISSAEAGDLRVGGADGPALELIDLPYSFEPESD
jgi:folate-binding protein YgfZ